MAGTEWKQSRFHENYFKANEENKKTQQFLKIAEWIFICCSLFFINGACS
jgi:hypothetical protein